MKVLLPCAVSVLALAGMLAGAGLLAGPALVPPLGDIAGVFAALAASGELFRELGTTVLRALAGVALANLAGVPLGLAAGFMPGALRLIAPLVAGLQSCPPVVWIIVVMVWAGTGGTVPVATVFAASLPFAFSTTAQGVMNLDRRVLAMGSLYSVPNMRVLRRFVLPAIAPYWLGGFSAVLATGWKAAAVAEFLGSHQGAGARIFWCYQKLHMEELFAWALALIVLGAILESAVITPLRKRAARLGRTGGDVMALAGAGHA